MLQDVEYQTPELSADLARYGYELTNMRDILRGVEKDTRPDSRRGVEEVVVTILATNPDPRYIEGIPVVLAKNDVDYGRLYSLAEERRVLKKLGWILSMAKHNYDGMGISYGSGLEETIARCRPAMDGKDEVLSSDLDVPAYRSMASRRRGNIAREWGILAIYFHEKLRRNLELYEAGQKKVA